MILYTCASCQRELEVEDSLAGQRVKCPHCGNIEVIPATARFAVRPAAAATLPLPSTSPIPLQDPTDRAAALGLPPDSGPEVNVKRVHPVMFRSRPSASLGVFTLVLGGFALAMAAYFSSTFANMKWVAYVGWVICLVGLGWIGWWKLTSMCTLLTITNKRTIVRRGLLSRQTREILHDQVNDLSVEQSFAQRLLRTGTLGIDGSGTDAIELVVDHLPDPDGLRKTIDAYREIG